MKKSEFRLQNSMGFLIGRGARIMAIKLHQNFRDAGYDLNVDHWIVLTVLLRKGGQNQQQLAMHTGRDKTAITRLIDGMEKDNLLVRVPDQMDRRSKLIYLTNKGKQLQKKLVALVEKTNEEVEENIDREELETCKKVLWQIFEKHKMDCRD